MDQLIDSFDSFIYFSGIRVTKWILCAELSLYTYTYMHAWNHRILYITLFLFFLNLRPCKIYMISLFLRCASLFRVIVLLMFYYSALFTLFELD